MIGVVLRRELLRLSRRAQTWVVRTIYSSFLLGFGLLILSEQLRSVTDPSQLGRIGHNLFSFYAGTQTIAVCVLAPILVASGVQEERDAQTLDLLALTGVGASRILFDQIASRLVALMAVVVAAAPFLAVILSFGGFGPMEAFNAVAGALFLAVILGNFTGFCAIVTRSGPILPLLLAVPYGLVVFGMPGAILEVIHGRDGVFVSPIAIPFTDEPWALSSLVFWIPAMVSGWGLAVPVFRIVTAGDQADDEFGLLSPDIWTVERYRRNTWAWALFAFCWLIFVLVLDDIAIRDRAQRFWLGWSSAAVFLYAAHRVCLILVLDGTRWANAFTAGDFTLWGKRHTLEPRRIWRYPVAWREVVARGSGRLRLWLGAALCWGLFGFFWMMAGTSGPDDHLATATLATFATALAATVMMVATLLDEKRRGSLQLLWLTHLDPVSVARQKLFAVLWITLPVSLPGALALATTPEMSWYAHGDHRHPAGEPLLQGLPLLPTLLWYAYAMLLVGNITLCASIAAAWARSSRTAWPLALLAGVLWLALPGLTLLAADWFDLLPAPSRDFEPLLGLWYPLAWDYYGPGCEVGGISQAALRATLVQFLAMPWLWHLFGWRLSRA